MPKKFDWTGWSTEELQAKRAIMEKGVDVRYPNFPEPDPEEMQSLKEEIAYREEKEEKQKECPKCGSPLVGLFFMGDRSQPPEFLVCKKCDIAYNPDNLKPMAQVIDGR